MNRRRIQARRTVVAKPQPSLWAKLDAARKAALAIEKNGQHHGEGERDEYEFARVEDVVKEAKRVFSAVGLLVIPAVVGDQRSWSPTAGLVLQVEMEFMVVDVDTGESITLPWIGYGQDKPGDKAIYAGISGAKKYFLSSLLEIAFVGIDPEQDKAADPVSLEAERERRKQDLDAEQPDVKEAGNGSR